MSENHLIIEEKKVSWLELFFDLAYVGAIAQLTYLTGSHHNAFEIFGFVIIFIMLFQTWWVTSINRNLDENEDNFMKIALQLQMFFVMMMSVFLGNIFDGGAVYGFLAGFIASRILSVLFIARMYYTNPKIRPKSYHILQGSIISILGFSLTFFVIPEYIFYAWALMVLFDFALPYTQARKKEARGRVLLTNPSHLQERLGLFVLLVLGESILVVAIISGLSNEIQTMQGGIIALLGFINICTMWWMYFPYLDDIMQGKRYKRFFQFSYAHISLFISMITFAIGIKQFLKDIHMSEYDDINMFVVIGIGLFIVSYHWIKFAMGHSFQKCMLHTASIGVLILVVFGITRYISDSLLVELAVLTVLFVCYTFLQNKKLKHIKK